MGVVIAAGTMSLDGFIANPDHTTGRLFDWMQSGTEAVTTDDPEISFRLTPQSAAHWRRWISDFGVLIVGREVFDLADGWQGRHPFRVPVVVLTHRPPTTGGDVDAEDFHFVTDGIAAAVRLARQLAGDRNVVVGAGTVARQALEAGLLDQVAVDLVPVVMGRGRPFFGDLAETPALLGDPVVTIQGDRVTHLVFPVLRQT